MNLETGSILIAVISGIILGIALWLIKKITNI